MAKANFDTQIRLESIKMYFGRITPLLILLMCFVFTGKNTITDSISNVWSDPRSLFAGCNEVTQFVLEHVATEKTRYAWDSVRFFWGKQIEYDCLKWWISYSIMDIKFVLQIKNGTNCMFTYSFIVFVGVRFLMKPWSLVNNYWWWFHMAPRCLLLVLCVVRLLEWRWWKRESEFLTKDEVHMCWGLNSHFFPVLGDGHNLIVGVYILIIWKDSLLKVGWPSPHMSWKLIIKHLNFLPSGLISMVHRSFLRVKNHKTGYLFTGYMQNPCPSQYPYNVYKHVPCVSKYLW